LIRCGSWAKGVVGMPSPMEWGLTAQAFGKITFYQSEAGRHH
jgi:hypothetical protein